jgi:hypothetical protein
MRILRPILFLALLVPSLAAAESLYKCDAAGAVTIQSEPCPKGSTQVWQRDATPEAGPSAEELAARAALAAAEAQRLAESARAAEQERIAELLRRDDEARLRAAEASGSARPERKSECTQAHEFADAANAKEWLNLSETQRDRLRNWVIELCKDPLGRPLDSPVTL